MALLSKPSVFTSSSRGISTFLLIVIVMLTGLGVVGGAFAYQSLFTMRGESSLAESTPMPSPLAAAKQDGAYPKVLGESTTSQSFLQFNLPTVFKDLLTATQLFVQEQATFAGAATFQQTTSFAKDVVIDGKLQLKNDLSGNNVNINLEAGSVKASSVVASNLLYSVVAGSGVSVSDGQNPTISNTDKGSDQHIFKTFALGSDSVSAGGNDDTFKFASGNGITTSLDTSNKILTIGADGSILNVSGWQQAGSRVFLGTLTNYVGIGTSTPATPLDVAGTTTLRGATTITTGGLGVTGGLTVANGSTLTGAFHVTGDSVFTGSVDITGGLTVEHGTLVSGGIDNQLGGIVNAGAITGATGFTSSGTITFSGLSTGIVHSSIGGVLSSSALNLAGGTTEISGVLPVGNGGTGLLSFNAGDILFAPSANTLAALGAGGDNQVLTVSGGIPRWGSVSATSIGPCTECVINDPNSTQVITASASAATPLSLRPASTQTADIFNVTDHNGTVKYFRIDSTGSIITGSTFSVAATGKNTIAIAPSTQASTYTATLTTDLLSGARTYTLPDITGTFCLTTGNCSGVGTNFGGSGTTNYLAKFSNTYAVANSVLYDDGTNVGIGTTSPTYSLQVAGNQLVSGNSVVGGTFDATGAAKFATTLTTSGATSLLSTLNVTGATTLSSTLGVTGNSTFGGSLSVAGNAAFDTNTLYVDAVNHLVGMGTTTPTAPLMVRGGYGSNDAFTVNQLNSGNIFTASSSGVTKLVLSNSGFLGIGNTTPTAVLDVANAGITTSNGINGAFNGLTSGIALNITSTSTGMTTGQLGMFDWSPSGTTPIYATGDLLSLNVGQYGNLSNIFNVKNNGSSVFSVSQSQITANLPTQFTSPGDVGFAYDLSLTNPTASFIKSTSSLYLQSGEIFNSSDLTLRTFNVGNVVVDSQALVVNQAATIAGQLVIGSTVAPASMGNFYLTNSGTFGKSLAILNQTENADIFTASSSGTNRFVIQSGGNVGIGTTAPNTSYKLDVAGNIGASSYFTIGGRVIDYVSGTQIVGGVSGGRNLALYAGNVERIRLDGSTGNVGIGTTSPASLVDIEGGYGGNAALIVNNLNSGDLFVASSSGITKFRIQNNGALTLANYTSCTSLTTDASGNVNCNTNANANVNYWQLSGTTLSPGNSTYDFALGGTGTASASLFYSGTSGYLGLGTTAPTAQLHVASVSTTFPTNGLGYFDWSPSGTTPIYATGDLLSLNVGQYGNLTNIFNVKNNGSSLFSVSQTQISNNLPVSFNAPGDIVSAYDLSFTNPTASFIKSSAPLYLQSGEVFNSSDLTLRTFNVGNVVVDSQALLINQAASVAGQLVIGSSVAPASIGNFYLTNSGTFGKSLAIFNQTEGADIFTASSSGATKFVIQSGGNVGIGTSTPTQKLSVAGVIGAGDGTASAPAFAFSSEPGLGIAKLTSGQISFTNGGVEIYNFSSSGFRGANSVGAFSLKESNGDATAPQFSFAGDTNAGLFRSGVDEIGLSTNGVSRLLVTSTGNIGVGTTSPTSLLSVGANSEFQVNTSGNIVSLGGAAHSIANSSGALVIDSASTGAINIGTGANAKTITLGNATGATALNFLSGTGSQTFTSLATTNTAFAFNASAITTGDLFAINATNGTATGNLFNILNNSSSLFSISASQITNNVPVQFTSPGDVSMAYDLNFTNPTASFIRSYAPLYLEAGDNTSNFDLTLRAFNAGAVIADAQVFVANQAATVAGQLVIGTTAAPANISNFYLTNSGTFGKSLAMINQTESADIFTASASGTTKFVITSGGNVGIGTANPGSNMLQVQGDFQVTGACSGCSSDERLKSDITQLGSGSALSNLLSLRGVTFNYADPQLAEVFPGEQLGVIAQDVEKVYPQLVGTDARGYKFVRYDKLIAPTIEAIREQQNQLSSLDSRVLGVNTQIGALIATSSATSSSSNATVMNNLDALTQQVTNHTSQLTTLNAQVASLSAILTQQDGKIAALQASTSAQLQLPFNLAAFNDASASATISSELTLNGNVHMQNVDINGLVVMGQLSFDPFESSLQSMTTLKLQPLSMGNVEIQGGQVVIRTNGNVELKTGVLVGNTQMRGAEQLSTGTTQLPILKTWDQAPISVTVTASYDTTAWVEELSSTGFTLKVGTPPTKNETLYWTAMW